MGHCILISGFHGSKFNLPIKINGKDKCSQISTHLRYRLDTYTQYTLSEDLLLHIISLTSTFFSRSSWSWKVLTHLRLLKVAQTVIFGLKVFHHECRYICWRIAQHASTRLVWPLSRSQQQLTLSMEINGTHVKIHIHWNPDALLCLGSTSWCSDVSETVQTVLYGTSVRNSSLYYRPCFWHQNYAVTNVSLKTHVFSASIS